MFICDQNRVKSYYMRKEVHLLEFQISTVVGSVHSARPSIQDHGQGPSTGLSGEHTEMEGSPSITSQILGSEDYCLDFTKFYINANNCL